MHLRRISSPSELSVEHQDKLRAATQDAVRSAARMRGSTIVRPSVASPLVSFILLFDGTLALLRTNMPPCPSLRPRSIAPGKAPLGPFAGPTQAITNAIRPKAQQHVKRLDQHEPARKQKNPGADGHLLGSPSFGHLFARQDHPTPVLGKAEWYALTAGRASLAAGHRMPHDRTHAVAGTLAPAFGRGNAAVALGISGHVRSACMSVEHRAKLRRPAAILAHGCAPSASAHCSAADSAL